MITCSVYWKIVIIAFALCAPPAPVMGMFKEFAMIKIDSNETMFWKANMYSLIDTPAGNDKPYIDIDVDIIRDDFSGEGNLTFLIFESDCNHIGTRLSEEDKNQYYCCTEHVAKLKKCGLAEIGEVIMDNQDGCIQSFLVQVQARAATVHFKKRAYLSTTGEYYLQISNCYGNKNLVGTVFLKGQSEWRNPFGYLPGGNYNKLRVSGIFTLFHLVVFIVFAVLCIKYRKILLTIQYGIFGVLAFCLIETSAWYFYRLGLNDIGYYNTAALCFVVFLTNAKKTALRILALLISMGIGTVKWTLGTTRMKIAYLAALYIFFSFLLQILKEMESLEKKKIAEWVIFLTVLPAAACDSGFFYWIILSMIRTLQQLTLRKQVLKLEMFKYYFGVLISAGTLAFIAISYQGFLRWHGSQMAWQYVWILDTFWDELYFFVLVAVSFLWRPRANNSRYGYAEFFTDDADDNDIHLSNKAKRKNEDEDDDFDKTIMSIDLRSDDAEDISIETEIKKMD